MPTQVSPGFRAQVYAAVRTIPQGRVLGYGHVAALMGHPRRARQVGFALSALDKDLADPARPDVVPWWRVLRSNGEIALQGDPFRGQLQEALLRAEDVLVVDHRVDMHQYRWDP